MKEGVAAPARPRGPADSRCRPTRTGRPAASSSYLGRLSAGGGRVWLERTPTPGILSGRRRGARAGLRRRRRQARRSVRCSSSRRDGPLVSDQIDAQTEEEIGAISDAATAGAVAMRFAAHACAFRARAFSSSCRFASAALRVNHVPSPDRSSALSGAPRGPLTARPSSPSARCQVQSSTWIAHDESAHEGREPGTGLPRFCEGL